MASEQHSSQLPAGAAAGRPPACGCSDSKTSAHRHAASLRLRPARRQRAARIGAGAAATYDKLGSRHSALAPRLLFMQQVLQRAMQHEVASAFFNEPVDPEALGIPEYRDVIQVSRRTLVRLDTDRVEAAFIAKNPFNIRVCAGGTALHLDIHRRGIACWDTHC